MLDKIFSKLERFLPVKYRWVLSHEGFKRYFSNTGWMFGGQMFSLFVSFFIGAWLARYLGPENYGIISYAMAFVGIFSFIASLGIDSILSRELVKYPEKRDELLGTAFRLKLIGGLIALVLCIASALVLKTELLSKLLIILFSATFILQAINVINIYFQAEVKSKNNVEALLFATFISSILKVAAIILNLGIIWIMLVYTLEFIWQWIGFSRAYNSSGLKVKNWIFNKNLAREILKNSWLLLLASAAGGLYLKIDQVMISFMMGNYELGLYAAAVRLTEVWYFIPGIICASLYPAIVNARQNNLEVYKNRLKNFYILISAISLAIAIPVTLLAKPIVYLLFGGGYLESADILKIYIWSNLGMFLGMAVYQYLITENKVKIIFFTTGLALVANVVLNLLFIPYFGLLGAAWATLISYTVFPISGLLVQKFSN